ncbi:DUF389 domain-containing protein [Streptomyces sp. MS1.AVA.1]|uniref:DUF389 domain-containing protein n=1 Tax=Streptomyces machairae TaxID=3134109 RepID=A0ABU8UUH1_9ACTN
MAFLAGIVGIVSLTEARGSALLGVFISVTTIPAASDMAVSLAFGTGTTSGLVRPTAAQRGRPRGRRVLALRVQRRLWHRATRRAAEAGH